jgi:hypothetical protein
MRDVSKGAAALDRSLDRVDAELQKAAGLAEALAGRLESRFVAIEARIAKLRPLVERLAGSAAPARRAAGAPPETAAERVDRWRADRLVSSPAGSIQARPLYRDFELWCEAEGAPVCTQATFGRLMRDRCHKKKSGTIKYNGVQLRTPTSNAEVVYDDARLLL